MDDAAIEELFAAVGPVAIRRMFGGKGVYAAGRIVAVVLRNELYLKSDEITAPALEAVGSRRWTYEREGRSPVAMPYHLVPDDAFDDPDAAAGWARLAAEASWRAAERTAAKPRTTRRGRLGSDYE